MPTNSSIHESATLYSDVLVQNSQIDKNASVGDFSKVTNSSLGESVRIDRYNHIDSSSIGQFTYTGKNSIILHAHIGNFSPISWNVSIGGGAHDYSLMTQHSFLYNKSQGLIPPGSSPSYDRYSESVNIGSDVWIGSGVVITRGITIGDGAVVGANAVVTKDIPPYAIAVGTPAKIIKYRFVPEVIELMLKVKWWNWSTEKIQQHFDILSKAPDVSMLRKLLNNDSI